MDVLTFLKSYNTPALTRVLEEVRSGLGNSYISGLSDSSLAFFIAGLSIKNPNIYFIITDNQKNARELHNDLEGILGEQSALFFPEMDLAPYEKRNMHPLVQEQRLLAISNIFSGSPKVITASFRSVCQLMVSPAHIRSNILELKTGDSLDLNMLTAKFLDMGYEEADMIENTGQISRRGGILDIFPPLAEEPMRIEFSGNNIESMRSFDIMSQRSVKRLENSVIYPCLEITFSQEKLEFGVKALERKFKPENSEWNDFKHRLLNIRDFSGITWMLDNFDSNATTLLEYLPRNSIIIHNSTGRIEDAHDKLLDFFKAHYLEVNGQSGFLSKPENLLMQNSKLPDLINRFNNIYIHHFKRPSTHVFNVFDAPSFNGNIGMLAENIRMEQEAGRLVIILCENQGQIKRLNELLKEYEVRAELVTGYFKNGFIINECNLCFYTDSQIFNRYVKRHKFKKYKGGSIIHHISTLKRGDYIVHEDYGVGTYLGIEHIHIDSLEQDCIILKYDKGDRLSVPVEDIDKIHKYSSQEGVSPALNQLRGQMWEHQKNRVKKNLNRIVGDIVRLYASRQKIGGHAFKSDSVWQSEFEDSFIYVPTPDQEKASIEIKNKMEKPIPMDCLLCGDVGFGKTEVVMRAAFKAVMDSRQVAVLVPTTVLAAQHFHTFSERFKDYPIKIEVLSRFKN
ncbi:MAG: CarD family transcriptional regulator, partial [bacterium]